VAILTLALCFACHCPCVRNCPCGKGHRGTARADQYGQVIVNDNDDLAYGLETV
jgi:hypothetical protein